MKTNSKIAVLGHRGMVGSAIVRELESRGYTNVINGGTLDLTNQFQTNDWFLQNKPEFVFLTAGRVGGIYANNTERTQFLYDNAMISANVISAAHKVGVKKLIYTASSCIYPVDCPKPIKEEYMLTGSLEPTNEPYAIAKILGVKLCENYKRQYNDDFICAMPTNSYGINDNYDLKRSHVLPAILRQVIYAKEKNIKEIQLWGTGKPKREFIYVDDMADALIFLMNNNTKHYIYNVGTGIDIPIKILAELIKDCVGWDGKFIFNGVMDGMLEKRLDISRMSILGWSAKTDLITGLNKTISHIYENEIHKNW